jgi:large subunit ribosomal protein L5
MNTEVSYKPRLQQFYQEKVIPELRQKNGYQNVMEVPRLVKISLNMGLGEATGNKKVIENAISDMTQIAGQKAVVTVARKAVASFKIREDFPIGCRVTLRRQRMYEFLDRFISIAAPRIRDFRGFSPKGFDGRGNYNLGIKEQIMFAEIDFDKVDAMRGMDINIVTTAKTDKEARDLLDAFGFPFRK